MQSEKILELVLELMKEKSGSKTENAGNDHPWEIGEKYIIRTVTMMLTGRLKMVGPNELLLGEACWIADSGRFNKALKGDWSESSEHEPFPGDCIVGRGSIVDAAKLTCELPRKEK